MVAEGQKQAGDRHGGKPSGRPKRKPLPELDTSRALTRLAGPPPPAPSRTETTHDKARRELITAPEVWMVLGTRVKLSEATARRLARSYLRAKPSRLDPAATGRFTARPYLDSDTWRVAAVYQPAGPDANGD